ncbi:hypothetical protein SAMN04487894_10949 [Niabella drilacis]|uniref:Type IV leader peptidase family protein n=2 Tax=Niabella drilacis (strain DSM 25811 / CCM 8410 / CCUG 62505 / LMG 26954 / E90) TaxID=1285928 RepID=A0A1G6URQ5_NIADE|nr:hypothetical protein SAMN04487894_10949 [Niabella drilacis]
MQLLSLLLLTAVLTAMTVRDFRFRAIEGHYYLLLTATVAFYTVLRAPAGVLVANLLINALLVLLLMAGLWGYFKARKGISLRELFGTQLGIGDLLFWVITAPLFAPLNFISWMTGSLLVILLVYGAVQVTGSRQQPRATIPLAGMQALLLGLLLGANQWVFHYDFFEEPLLLTAGGTLL